MSWSVTFLMQITFDKHNYMSHKVWGQSDHPSGLGGIPVQILALSFHILGHHSPNRASFHPITRWQHFLYDTKSSWVLNVYLVEVGFPPFWHPFCWFSLREMGQNGDLTNYCVVSFHLCSNDIYISKEQHLQCLHHTAIYLKWSRLVL